MTKSAQQVGLVV